MRTHKSHSTTRTLIRIWYFFNVDVWWLHYEVSWFILWAWLWWILNSLWSILIYSNDSFELNVQTTFLIIWFMTSILNCIEVCDISIYVFATYFYLLWLKRFDSRFKNGSSDSQFQSWFDNYSIEYCCSFCYWCVIYLLMTLPIHNLMTNSNLLMTCYLF
jgi:hypothetical protein